MKREMNFSLYIAKRYLVAKKSHNVINIISGISVVGVATGTMALIVILSVFNGFDSLLKSLFSVFDPELEITLVEGKTFSVEGDERFERIKEHPGVLYFTEVLEENALLMYGERQHIATMKGVEENFTEHSELQRMMMEGSLMLKDDMGNNFAVLGRGVANVLAVGLSFLTPLEIYIPSRTAGITMNPDRAFNRRLIYPSGVFSVEQETDMNYLLVPLDFAREILEFREEVTSVELGLSPGFRESDVQDELQEILGDEFRVLNRYQQQEWLYKVMQSEKWAIFLILAFILVVASFNIIGSITMLIIEKKKDIAVLKSLGATENMIRKIFLFEGWMISVVGAAAGLLIGLAICVVQMEFGVVKLYGSGTFIIDAYPVELQFTDFIYVFLTVLLIGFFAALVPVRYITRRFFSVSEQL
ncbi:MAG: FtsX-like permease family protein [Marinilabiliales bacterium]|nr:MAG: FtsX-like permease family protein [Marinilabiliales bacterium]